MLTIGLLLSRTCRVDLVNFRGLYENLPAQMSVNNIAKHLNCAEVTDEPRSSGLPDCSYLNILKTLTADDFPSRDIEGTEHALKRADEEKGVELTVLDLDDDQVEDSLPNIYDCQLFSGEFAQERYLGRRD